MKVVMGLTLMMLLAGCWNGHNTNVRMGDVSIGQQMIDLARALEEGAIDAEEHARLKAGLMALATPGERD